MLRIRKISNPYLEYNHSAMMAVRDILAKQFPDLWKEKIDLIDEQLINPLRFKYQTFLLVAENIHESILGFALLKYMPDVKFCFLDFIATRPGKTSSGVGSFLYQRIREEAVSLNVSGLFFECLPDDPALCRDTTNLEQNKKRLAFYERFGARPVINTLYETLVKPEDDCPPYLMFDNLGEEKALTKSRARRTVRAILERIYPEYCPPEYIDRVVNSIKSDPVILRPLRYRKKISTSSLNQHITIKNKIFWITNDKNSIHNIHQRGYVESPVRIPHIKAELEKTAYFRTGKSSEFPDRYILDVHDKNYVNYFKKVCSTLNPGKSVYPYVFPIRNSARPPKELSVRAGYFCIDTFTPLNLNAYLAARAGVNCTLTAVNELLSGTSSAYVLTRPPGHHAERFVFGGFCYFNNNAIAANYLSRFGRVAILDIDYHHGNGQQQIFYARNDVLTISIHGHPSFAYPYFSGFADEKGEGPGTGFNYNFPLSEDCTPDEHKKILSRAIKIIMQFSPDYLVVAFGLDTAKGDPTGTWKLATSDFEANGRMIGAMHLPTIVVQEGGYRTQSIGRNAKAFFDGYVTSRTNSENKKTDDATKR
ncbi:MAG TPA: histone deacetylase family protein [Bacteroidales bacterium]|nr:histone deacetylase family protein [Bacteroidales bacterium]